MHVFSAMNPKTTAEAVSDHLKNGQTIVLRYRPENKGMATAIAIRVRPPKGGSLDEHWREDRIGPYVSMALKQLLD